LTDKIYILAGYAIIRRCILKKIFVLSVRYFKIFVLFLIFSLVNPLICTVIMYHLELISNS
jgi:hypothetical protein